MLRVFDFLAAAAILLILSPILVIVLIAVVTTSPGGAFYSDPRMGLNGRIFGMLKFRSMRPVAQDDKNWMTQDNDPRITKVGAFLRKTSIDELPQLINVLFGDMSLVGPRPESPKAEKVYTEDYWAAIQTVRPGITGLAQINGRSALNLEQKIQYDLTYIDNISNKSALGGLLYNVGILMGTFGALSKNTN